MVKQSRRSKHSRKSKQSRRSRNQLGGGDCAARPLNHQMFQMQRGGMAPFNYDNALLLDQPTRMQAEVAGLDRHIADSQVLAKQAGGRRRNRKTKGRKSQRGGNHLAAFDGSYELLSAGARSGQNPQFHNEHQIRESYHENKGAQA